MSFQLDHIVISVQDLNTAIDNYRALGFTVLEGGKHSSGTTENAIIAFKDGTYIELIAPTGDAPSGAGTDFSPLVNETDGVTGFALLSSNLEQDAARMAQAGIPVQPVQTGKRTKTDGTEIRWKMALIEGTMSPFLIQDETPRHLRVSDAEADTTHANGVEAVQSLLVVVEDVGTVVARYNTILGTNVDVAGGEAVYSLAGSELIVKHATTADEHENIQIFGESPYELRLTSGQPQRLAGNTHRARLRLV